MTTGMTTLWRVAPQKRYSKTKQCLARGHVKYVVTMISGTTLSTSYIVNIYVVVYAYVVFVSVVYMPLP